MRFKMVACILLIVSVSSFVLAAPVPVREVRKARADTVEEDENVIIVSGNRAPRGNPSKGEESDLYPPDLSGWTTPPDSPSTPDDASGSHLGVDMPSSPSGGSKSPLLSSGTEVPLDPEGTFKSGTTTENQPVLPSKTKSVSWAPSKVKLPSGVVISKPLPPEIEEGHPGNVATQQPSSLEIEHASSSSHSDLFPPPQSKGFVSNFKTFINKLSKLNFRPRFQRTVDTGALTVGNIQVGESSNALAISATGGILRRVAGMF